MSEKINEYLQRGPATSKEIQAATGLSQAAVSRRLRSMGDRVIRVREGRAILYAVTRNAFGGTDKLPLSRVDPQGNIMLIAFLRPLAHGGFFLEPSEGVSSLLLGENKQGLYDDLPYFLLDCSPQGFIGRKIALEMASRSDVFPADPKRWTTEHIGRYLLSNGDDLPGNFTLGEQAMLRVRRKPVPVPDVDYPALAESVIEGEVPGSSAAGEQPKFTAFSEERSAHVIVKFSPKGENELARRWRDILLTEYHAAQILDEWGYSVAATRLLEAGGRLFLESQRFDRIGEYGRRNMVSLSSIDAEFVGIGAGWSQVCEALFEQGLISTEHVHDAECLWLFGKLINNTDMHLGNISMAMEGDMFSLLPIYDMCSMGFAPKSGGEVAPYHFVPKKITGTKFVDQAALQRIEEMAYAFWERIAAEERISDELRVFLGKGNPVGLMIEC
ncbi:MAG: type II toxin-antitoxin system HipA family toxin YjjJ [Candidatus Electrothrix aestuarii]|uniref:Type II toxin-antitoxin system HipA family toxin YjjJ n=1 Tax=Candidatus Electrothrix aestuarii TaxID=3062594 RepID=A0AAU8LXR4_9BACT|nr:type II toxin-antitoxin system HipA family toxin YjjJ [Candidatus Electrothrix aestuarii]